MMNKNPHQIIIAGNGYLPYLIALCIQRRFGAMAPKLSIVDLGDRAQVALMQSLGSMRRFHADLGISEVEFVKATRADIHLGVEYLGFSGANHNEIFCDSSYGFDLQNRKFFHLFNKLRSTVADEKLEAYCLCAQLVRKGRFTPPSPNARSVYASINYGYRLTEEVYTGYLQSLLDGFDVRVLRGEVDAVCLDADGYVESVTIDTGEVLRGDFFIDASESRIIKRVIGEDNGAQPLYPIELFVETACVESDRQEKLLASRVQANQVSIQLSGSYSSYDYTTTISLKGDPSSRIEYFRDAQPWIKNCLAMGCAFTNRLPILVDNSHINQRMLLRLFDLWPRSATMISEARAYNASTWLESTHVTDMDCVHLALAFNRPDLLSDTMDYKLKTFLQSGKVAYYEKELLQEQQWPVLFDALGVQPNTIDLSVRTCEHHWLTQQLSHIKNTLAKAADAAPLYRDFIDSAHG